MQNRAALVGSELLCFRADAQLQAFPPRLARNLLERQDSAFMHSRPLLAASRRSRQLLSLAQRLMQAALLLFLLLGAAAEPHRESADFASLISSPLSQRVTPSHRDRDRRASVERYCGAWWGSASCCRGRNDSCSRPLRDTLCYCDEFCNQLMRHDCCPDYWNVCQKIVHGPVVQEINRCRRDNEVFQEGARMRRQCNACTCIRSNENFISVLDWLCSDEACVVEDGLVNAINEANLGWSANGYRSFWSLSLEQGVRYLLGTSSPTPRLAEMRPISSVGRRWFLPDRFDARTAWPQGFIRQPRDQGRCGSDWAVATADVLADRLSIISNGTVTEDLSVQQLVSCTRHEHGCADSGGGRVEEAFTYMSSQGVVTEDCYPYSSGRISARLICRIDRWARTDFIVCPNGGRTSKLHKGTPPYRIASDEWEIMTEIKNSGPVLAIMEVWPDFYLYYDGVYQRSGIPEKDKEHVHNLRGYHSVRIIGWGVERGAKYWLVANSWGREWGQDGTFKILRGVNECGIESFVVGVWGDAERP